MFVVENVFPLSNLQISSKFRVHAEFLASIEFWAGMTAGIDAHHLI